MVTARKRVYLYQCPAVLLHLVAPVGPGDDIKPCPHVLLIVSVSDFNAYVKAQTSFMLLSRHFPYRDADQDTRSLTDWMIKLFDETRNYLGIVQKNTRANKGIKYGLIEIVPVRFPCCIDSMRRIFLSA